MVVPLLTAQYTDILISAVLDGTIRKHVTPPEKELFNFPQLADAFEISFVTTTVLIILYQQAMQ